MAVLTSSLSTSTDTSGLIRDHIYDIFLIIYISFRITPFYALYVGFIATLLFHLGSGPLWHFVSQKKDACRLNWWKHFLYIDNYFTLSNPPTEVYIHRC